MGHCAEALRTLVFHKHVRLGLDVKHLREHVNIIKLVSSNLFTLFVALPFVRSHYDAYFSAHLN